MTGTATNATTAVNFTGSLAGDVSGTQSLTTVNFVGGQSASNVATGTSLANSATNLNTNNAIVKRDGSGGFSAGTITANLTGTATNATTAVNFTGSLAGDITGGQGTTLVSTVGGQSASSVSSGVILANAATNLNTNNTIVKRDGSGSFSATTVTANLVGNVSGTATNATTAVNFSGSLAGDVTGGQSSNIVSFVGGQSASSVSSGVILANNATNLNTANTIVKRDGTGSFTVGTITGNLNGNATSATSAITATTATNATNFTGSLAGNVTGTQGATVVSTVGGQTATNVAAATVLANNATNLNTANTIVKRDVNGDFSVGTITGAFVGNLTGNASTATTTTNFTGNLLGDISGNQNTTLVNTVGGQSSANIASATLLANNATNLNTANTIVKRDLNGDFASGTISANLIGNVTGNVSGSAGSTVNFTGNLLGDVTGTQNSTLVASVGGQNSANIATATTLANNATNLNTANTIVKRDGSGAFVATNITSNLTGTVTGSASLNVLKAGDTMTGTLIIPAGSTSVPSLQFTGSTNTGISASSNTLSLNSNGTSYATLNNTALTTTTKLINTNVRCNQGIQAVSLATGGTATSLSGTSILLINGGSTVNNCTIVFPPSPTNGQLFTIALGQTQAVSSITNSAPGNTIVNAITALSPSTFAATTGGTSVTYLYYAASTSWYRHGRG